MQSLADGVADTTGYRLESASGQVFRRGKVLERHADAVRDDRSGNEWYTDRDESQDKNVSEQSEKRGSGYRGGATVRSAHNWWPDEARYWYGYRARCARCGKCGRPQLDKVLRDAEHDVEKQDQHPRPYQPGEIALG
jgi:hypothetical protein